MNNNRTSSKSHRALHLRREQCLVELRREREVEHAVEECQVVWVGAIDERRQVDELDAGGGERNNLMVGPHGDVEDVIRRVRWWLGIMWWLGP